MLPTYSNFEQVYLKTNNSTDNLTESFKITQSGWYILKGQAYTNGPTGSPFATGIEINGISILGFSAEKDLGAGWGLPQFSGICYLSAGINVEIRTRYGTTILYKVS